MPVTTSPVSALRRVARAALLAAAATAAPAAPAALTASCSYNVERPRLHVTRVEWLGLDTQGVTLRATVAAYNPNDFELPLRDLRATLTVEGVSTPASVGNFEAVLPPRREVPVTVDAMIPWAGVPDAARVAFSRPRIAYRLDGSITAERYITVTTNFTHAGTVNRDELVRNALPAGLGSLLGSATDLLGQFVTVQAVPPAPAASTDAGAAPGVTADASAAPRTR